MVSLKELLPGVGHKKLKKDFVHFQHATPYVNKRLNRQYQKYSKSFWQRWWILIILAAPLLIILIVIHLPFFTIKNVVINNVASKPTEDRLLDIINEVKNRRRWLLWPESNIFFFSKDQAIAAMSQEFYSEQVEIQKFLPNVVKVNFKENLIVGSWEVGDKKYALDDRGVLVQEIQDLSAKSAGTIKIKEAGEATHNLGDNVVDPTIIRFIKDANAAWLSNISNFKVSYYLYDEKSLPTIQAVTDQGWFAYLTVMDSASSQVGYLKRILDEKLKQDTSNVVHIDLRYGSKVYIKNK